MSDQTANSVPVTPPAFAADAQAWLAAPTRTAKISHNYDTRQLGFKQQDQEYLNGFLNHMQSRGASQADIGVLVEKFRKNTPRADVQAELAAEREIAALDKADSIKGTTQLRHEWGNNFTLNMRILQQHIAGLSVADREKLDAAETPSGVLGLNDPDTLKQLFQTAKKNPELEAQARNTGKTERALLQEMMKDKRSAYWKGPTAARYQARYMELVEGKR